MYFHSDESGTAGKPLATLKLTARSFPHNFELSFTLAGLNSHEACAWVGFSIVSANRVIVLWRTLRAPAFSSVLLYHTFFVRLASVE